MHKSKVLSGPSSAMSPRRPEQKSLRMLCVPLLFAVLFSGIWTGRPCWAEPVASAATMAPSTPSDVGLKTVQDAIAEDADAAEDAEALAHLELLSRAYAVIAERVRPSVVSIRALAINTEIHAELRKMFGDDERLLMPLAGTGSGVIIAADGYIVTNNHVVDEADAVWVTLDDGRELRAQIVGTDHMSDLAVIKIDAEGLIPCRLGDSDTVRVGNIVLAIGSPFKLGHSVTQGIISAVGRHDVQVDINYKNWLQTDAPINPGNSGGPLVNTRGEVVGISVAIATESGGYQGVGFAIPANTVARVAERLKRGEKIVRGYLGVEIKPVNRIVADAYGLTEVKGALLGAVGKSTPAEKAGLKSEDIVLSIDGQDVLSLDHLQDAVAWIAPGTKSVFNVWRGGRAQDVTVEIGEQPPGFRTQGSRLDLFGQEDAEQEKPARRRGQQQSEPARKSPQSESSRLPPEGEHFEQHGMWAATLTPELREKFQMKEDEEPGVVITRIDPLGEAFRADLRPGHIIREVNGQPIETLADFKRVLNKLGNAKGVRLHIQVGRQTFHTVMKLR